MQNTYPKSGSKTAVYVGGFGPRKLEEKFHLLEKNLKTLSSQLDHPLDVFVNCYAPSSEKNLADLFGKLKSEKVIGKGWIHVVPGGVLAGMWIKNPYNKKVAEYDQVVMILDDVQIQHLQLVDFETEKKSHKLDIISASVTNSSHPRLMHMKKEDLTKTNCSAEMFFYLMGPKVFQRYIDIQNADNPWIWGVDFLLKHIGFNVGISPKCVCHHLFKNLDKNNSDKYRDMIRYLDNFYPSLKKNVLEGIRNCD